MQNNGTHISPERMEEWIITDDATSGEVQHISNCLRLPNLV